MTFPSARTFLDKIRQQLQILRDLGLLEFNPRSIGQALHGSELGEFWKHRVGDYRLICKIEDDRLVVLVLRIGHRREVYR